MHTEYISVRRETIQKLIKHEGYAIAVGFYQCQNHESLYYMGLKVIESPNLSEEQLHVQQWEPYERVDHEDRIVNSVEALKALDNWMGNRGLEVLHSNIQIIIAPGYDYHIVKMLVTDFRQPQSTLLLLVGAFVKRRLASDL